MDEPSRCGSPVFPETSEPGLMLQTKVPRYLGGNIAHAPLTRSAQALWHNGFDPVRRPSPCLDGYRPSVRFETSIARARASSGNALSAGEGDSVNEGGTAGWPPDSKSSWRNAIRTAASWRRASWRRHESRRRERRGRCRCGRAPAAVRRQKLRRSCSSEGTFLISTPGCSSVCRWIQAKPSQRAVRAQMIRIGRP